MKAADIIKQIAFERGIDFIGKGDLDLVPLNDLNVHKREIWNLSVTSDPQHYFSAMDKEFKNRMSYSFKFAVDNLSEGQQLCRELSKDFGTPPCEMTGEHPSGSPKQLFLAIHIHAEFSFTPKTSQKGSATQEMVLQFV